MDIQEFEKMIQKYEKDIFSFCCHLTMSKQQAEDLYQDTILKAFETINKINLTDNPKSLLISIAIGKWKNIKRKFLRRNKISLNKVYNYYYTDKLSSENSSEIEAIKNIQKNEINKTIKKLDEKYKIPIILFYQQNYNIEKISKICKITKGTVKSRLYKGRKLLKNYLEKEGF